MKHASESQNNKGHFIDDEIINQKRNKKKILIGILVAAIAVSGVLVPLSITEQSKSSGSEQTLTPAEISYTDARIAEARTLTAAAKATKSMSENIEIPITAYSLKVDGKTIAVMTSDDDIRTILSSIKKKAANYHFGMKIKK